MINENLQAMKFNPASFEGRMKTKPKVLWMEKDGKKQSFVFKKEIYASRKKKLEREGWRECEAVRFNK